VEQLGRCEPHPLQVDLNETPVAREVRAVYIPLTVLFTVVFMDSTSPNNPQVSARDEAAPVLEDLLLRLDLDARSDVEHAEY
jgi:hypothetical protein